MHQDEIIFVINEQERIRVPLPCALDDISRYDWIDAEYIHDDVCNYTIYSGFDFGDFIGVLAAALQQAVSGDCKIDESLQENLGYLWNVYVNKSANTPAGKEVRYWIGYRYLIWGTLAVDVWLYEKEGKFFFEITPIYRWHYRDVKPEEKDIYITYKNFIKNYKPYVVTELSRETICEWLKQLQHLQSLIDFNEDKYSSRANRDSAS